MNSLLMSPIEKILAEHTSNKDYDGSNAGVVHVVLDLETLGLAEDAAIISLGAVGLDKDYQIVGGFYRAIDFRSATFGRSIDKSTLEWWQQQPIEAWDGLAFETGCFVVKVFTDFACWLPEGVKLWGNGPEFDNRLLAHAYQQYKFEVPWKVWNNHSIRTLGLVGEEFLRHAGDVSDLKVKPVVKHHALQDALAEAIFLRNVMRNRPEVPND